MALVSFDLNGTLLDPGARTDALDRAVELAIAHTLAGSFRSFVDFQEAAGGALPAEMPPFPDVTPALDALRRAGHQLAVLTNSARENAERHLAGAGLRDRFEQVVSADAARAYKPDSRVYDLLESDWHVAAHWWDILGAAAVGRRTVYVARREPLPSTVEADIVVERLDELDPMEL